MTLQVVSIEQVLSNWRFSICFAESIRTETGEYGTVVGKDSLALLDVVLGKASDASNGRGKFRRDQVFPAWWPESQFHESSGRGLTQ
jgi:hypothetical protein